MQLTKKIHDLKCWPVPYEAIVTGEKTFEWRMNDRDYRVGDILVLHEYNPNNDRLKYTGRMTAALITYILGNGEFGIPEGYCIMSIRRIA
jgi:hypothetical protein